MEYWKEKLTGRINKKGRLEDKINGRLEEINNWKVGRIKR